MKWAPRQEYLQSVRYPYHFQNHKQENFLILDTAYLQLGTILSTSLLTFVFLIHISLSIFLISKLC